MFDFLFKKRPVDSCFADGIDHHCHILPGVDDGVTTMEESLAIIRRMQELGFVGAYCTPHIMRRFPNTPSSLRAVFQRLAVQAAGLNFSLHLAAEYMIEERFEAVIRSEKPLAWDDKYVLVELPQYMLPPGWMDSISLVRDLGYTPVLAHPERYGRILELEDLEDLADMGILFQGNVGALNGYYGSRVQALALELKKRKLYFCWGTDAHSIEMLNQTLQ